MEHQSHPLVVLGSEHGLDQQHHLADPDLPVMEHGYAVEPATGSVGRRAGAAYGARIGNESIMNEDLNKLPTHRLLGMLKVARAKASAIRHRSCQCGECRNRRDEYDLMSDKEIAEAMRPYTEQIARIKMILMGRPHSEKAHKKPRRSA